MFWYYLLGIRVCVCVCVCVCGFDGYKYLASVSVFLF